MNNLKEFFQYIFDAIKIWVIIQPWQSGILVRGGKNMKILSKGIYFRIPYFDSVYIQEVRLRICSLPMQTITTKDLKTITIGGGVGYSISNIMKLYNTLFHPETTIRNIVMSEIADYVFKTDLAAITPDGIQNAVLEKLKNYDYGLNFEYFKISTFAVVRTYRLIQDTDWGGEALQMDTKK